jgi:hypothetical protein
MSSERKRQANRNNAQRSTGPRTVEGKRRARANSRQHGLATQPALLPQIHRMAKAICEKGASRLQYEQALNIATSQFAVQAVRAARIAAIKRMLSVQPTPNEQIADTGARPPEGEAQPVSEEQSLPEIDDVACAFAHVLPEMTRYDRYERRALSRRKRAIRRLVATSILGVRPTRRQR